MDAHYFIYTRPERIVGEPTVFRHYPDMPMEQFEPLSPVASSLSGIIGKTPMYRDFAGKARWIHQGPPFNRQGNLADIIDGLELRDQNEFPYYAIVGHIEQGKLMPIDDSRIYQTLRNGSLDVHGKFEIVPFRFY